jgi:hypothetical protein
MPSCFNPCEECEVCAGNAPPSSTCSGMVACDFGRATCGSSGASPCSPGYYCITGCCVPEPT